jgi:hypothetical protein
MANQTIVKPLGLIKDFKILVHGIPYAVTFVMIQSSVLESSYCMFLGCPWLRNAKVFHNWGNETISIRGTSIIRTMLLPRNLEHQLSDQRC